ncbi:hypothetical protein Tco_0910743 [Tanacetum coccineum]|uniref:Uncharacterized protein n=1 Tax=Tanacetum coccineum TaxID=301880 RepID=A0ABQ5CVZ0_9ASTR
MVDCFSISKCDDVNARNSKDVNLDNEKNYNENVMEEDDNKTVSFMASRSSKDSGSSKSGVETELMLEEKFRDLCEEVSNFVKESKDVVKEVERLSCKDVAKETVHLLRCGQKHDLYKMTCLQMMMDESHLSVHEKHTFVSKMNLGTLF